MKNIKKLKKTIMIKKEDFKRKEGEKKIRTCRDRDTKTEKQKTGKGP